MGYFLHRRIFTKNCQLPTCRSFADLSLRGIKQPTRAQPNPAHQGDLRELDMTAAAAPAADDDDDDWMAEYQAALAAGKFEMTGRISFFIANFEKLVTAPKPAIWP